MTTDRMLRVSEVLELAALSRASLYRRMADSGFPKPRRMGPRAVRWMESEVINWINERPAADGQ